MDPSAHSPSDWLMIAHKLLGFVTVLLVTPATLWATPGSKTHRRLGLAYVACMIVLYLSGTFFTFRNHDLLGYKFLRNLAFNAFGVSLMLLGWRAMPLKCIDGGRVSRVDRGLVIGLATLALLMLPLGFKRWPMFVLGGIGLALAWIDWQELRAGVLTAAQRLERHMRYMLASVYYVVTLLSILLLPGTFKLKWVWPSAVAGVAILLLTRPGLRERFGWSRTATIHTTLRLSAILALGLGLVALYQFASTGRLFAGVEG